MTKPELEQRVSDILEAYGENYWNAVEFAREPNTAGAMQELIDLFTEYAQSS